MANLIAVNADSNATTTSTSAVIAKRNKDFIQAYCVSSVAGDVSGVSTFCIAVTGSSGTAWNCPGSFPAIAALIKFIQIGGAACAPVSFAPRVFFSSYPSQTPQVIVGENPTN